MSGVKRRVAALERATGPPMELIAVYDEAEAEREKAARAARGETRPALIVITGVPRNPDFGKW